MGLLKTTLPAAQTGGSQSQRLVQHFGLLDEMEGLLTQPGFELSAAEDADSSPTIYVQCDGGMLLTDDGYRETKIGRVFADEHRKRISSDNEGVNKRYELERSDYLAHMGDCTTFTNRFDKLIGNHTSQNPEAQLVVITDGADWIADWIKKSYPTAIPVLDFFHVIEKISEFATMIFSSEANKELWIKARATDLLDGKVGKVILAIRTKAVGRRAAILEKSRVVTNYLDKNQYRMKYDEYRAKGHCIGSGAIESAVSTVMQQRCKLVGQRWTQRVQAVLNLRAAFKSGKRSQLRKLISQQMGYQNAA
jgi:hypothetical protein